MSPKNLQSTGGFLFPYTNAWTISPSSSLTVNINRAVLCVSFYAYRKFIETDFSRLQRVTLQFTKVDAMEFRNVDNDAEDFFRSRYNARYLNGEDFGAYVVLPPGTADFDRSGRRPRHFAFEAHDVAVELVGLLRSESVVGAPSPDEQVARS